MTQVEKIKSDNAIVLATPLFSEGGIGPTQVFRMSRRQFATLQANQQKRLELESQIRLLSRSDAQIAKEEKDSTDRKRNSRKGQIEAQLHFIATLGGMSHKANGKLKPTYQRTADALQAELSALESRLDAART